MRLLTEMIWVSVVMEASLERQLSPSLNENGSTCCWRSQWQRVSNWVGCQEFQGRNQQESGW